MVQRDTSVIPIQPKTKKTEKDMRGSRIVLVCPYSNITHHIREKIYDLAPSADVDVVDVIDDNSEESSYTCRFAQQRYVIKREANLPKPAAIIDFQRVIRPFENYIIDNKKLGKLRRQSVIDFLNQKPEEFRDNIKEYFKHMLNEKIDQIWPKTHEQCRVKKDSFYDIIDFHGYSLWSEELRHRRGDQIAYFRLKLRYSLILKELHEHINKNFIPDSISINLYPLLKENLNSDLVEIVSDSAKLVLFDKRNLD